MKQGIGAWFRTGLRAATGPVLGLGLFGLGLVGLAPAPAFAQDQNVDEIVVTGSRYREAAQRMPVPQVTLAKRADFVVRSVDLYNDTRDPKARAEEMRQTLRNILREADKDQAIEIGGGGDAVTKLDQSVVDRLIRVSDDRDDESRAILVVKTPVAGPNDTIEAATARVDAFLKRIQKVGRSEFEPSEEIGLSLVRPGQYRNELLKAIAADAKTAASLLGPDYGAQVSGLEKEIAWRRSGPLELSLYVPYTLSIGRRGN